MTGIHGAMRALVFSAPKQMRLETVPVPKTGPGELLVRVRYAGVCGTDVRIYLGTKRIPTPRILGHEFAGEVVASGTETTGFAEGERVVVHPMLACGRCHACRAGRSNICLNRITLGYELDGGFADYVRIPAEFVSQGNVVHVPQSLPLRTAAVAEPFAAALHGIHRAQLSAGQSVLLVGAGPIGLGHVLLAATAGARVLVSEPDAQKRELATELGAQASIDPTAENVAQRVNDLTDGQGVDCVIVDVGVPSVVEDALQVVRKGGRFVLFAGMPAGDKIAIDPNWIHYREIDFTGSSSSTPSELSEVLQRAAEGRLPIERLITGEVPLDAWETAIANKSNYVGLKTVLAVSP